MDVARPDREVLSSSQAGQLAVPSRAWLGGDQGSSRRAVDPAQQ
jgi:hypothetical protein